MKSETVNAVLDIIFKYFSNHENQVNFFKISDANMIIKI